MRDDEGKPRSRRVLRAGLAVEDGERVDPRRAIDGRVFHAMAPPIKAIDPTKPVLRTAFPLTR